MVRTFLVALSAATLAALGASSVQPRDAAVGAATVSPATGWTLHIDAKRHFGEAHAGEIAHHWCKPVSGDLVECQIYESDAPDARLVAVETIVKPPAYAAFDATERALWHYHKDEIPKVDATLPDMTPDEAKRTVAGFTETYGKVWVLWDPQTSAQPSGTPWVSVLK